MGNSLEPEKTVLVVGDWVVDEHWSIGVHRSSTSSRTGTTHYRALHLPTSTVESLCGAGRTASVLHQIVRGGNRLCNILGIGIWHEKDTGVLAEMLDPVWNCQQTPHQVSGASSPSSGEEKLFNLGRIIAADSRLAEFACGTTRMIRIYQQTGARFSLLQRIDWETQLPDVYRNSEGENVWIGSERQLEDSDLSKFIDRYRATLSGVVIKDLHKGVISDTLIKWLVENLPRVPWFVSTKEWWPSWFDIVKNADVRLVMIPQVATLQAIRKGELNRWITRTGDASDGALYRMDQLGRKFRDRAMIVALPDGLSVLARDRARLGKSGLAGLVQKETGPEALVSGMPMASVFFPALIAHLLQNEDVEFDRLLKKSLAFTHKWMSLEEKRVEEPEYWRPGPDQVLDLDADMEQTALKGQARMFDESWLDLDWEQARREWEATFSNYGILGPRESGRRQSSKEGSMVPAGRKRIEISRSMLEVDGYVCCTKQKRRTLQGIVSEIGSFASHHKRDHKSCMLIASPGSGKTYLVRCIAKSLKLTFLGFNITQMISKGDLLDCFDTIVTNQAQNRDQPLLVFVDEINARLDGQHVYDAFLAPLEEHVYVRAGKTFHIDPCIWVFAGTEFPVDRQEMSRDRSDKASDFVSRLSARPFDLIHSGESDGEERLEKVYLGVSLLRSTFPDVRKVSEKVLRAFHSLPPALEAREVKHFVESFVDIQYGEVKEKNIDDDRLKHHVPDIENWHSLPEGDLVEIRG
jgi:ATPase family associated with various cellular activities (AAA)